MSTEMGWMIPTGIVAAALIIGSCGANTSSSPSLPVTDAPSPTTSAPSSTITTSPPSAPVATWTTILIRVEYRADTVDVGHPRFDYHSTAGSSVGNGAWYDADSDYLLIALDNRFYHYCRVPDGVWAGFTASPSYGRYSRGG